MIETVKLDTARENADAVSRLIEQFLGTEDKDANVQDIVKFAHLLWLIVRDIWEQFQLRLDQGLEAGRARHVAASASLACDSLLRVATQLEDALTRRGTGEVEGFSELIAAAPKVKAIQKAARDLVDVLNTSGPPIDEARLAEGKAAAGRGDFEDTAAIVERLRIGGKL